MSREEMSDDYKKEWNKQFGSELAVQQDEEKEHESPEPEQEEEVQEQEVEERVEEDSGEESESPKEEKSEDSSQEEPQKRKTKDDEYREFIESQPDEVHKEQARKIVQALRSADGRTSALHRQLNAREQLVQQLYASQQRKGADAPTSARQPDKQEGQQPSQELPEKVKALKEKNPQAAEIIEEIAKYYSNLSQQQMQEIVDKRLAALETDHKKQEAADKWQQLETRAKDLFGDTGVTARDIVQSEDFKAWLEIKRIEEPGVYRLAQSANDPDTAFIVLEKYERDYQAALQEAGLADESQQTHNKGDEIRNRREKSRQTGASVKPTRTKSPTTDRSNLSYEEEFNLMWANKGK